MGTKPTAQKIRNARVFIEDGTSFIFLSIGLVFLNRSVDNNRSQAPADRRGGIILKNRFDLGYEWCPSTLCLQTQVSGQDFENSWIGMAEGGMRNILGHKWMEAQPLGESVRI
jgi:hypothetical protein